MRHYCVIFILLICHKLSATSQAPDYLIIGKDTFQIFSNPLELYFEKGKRPKILDNWCSTACWRGYVAYWKITNDSLFLVELNSCCEKNSKIDLKEVFPNRNPNQPIFADWVTDTLTSPSGKLLNYVHMGYGSTYERETDYIFQKGVFKSKKEYLNATVESQFENLDSLKFFFRERISWAALPKIDTLLRVIVQVKADRKGKIIMTKVGRSPGDIWEKEALRLIGLIKTMPIIIRRDTILYSGWTLFVVFDPSQRKG